MLTDLRQAARALRRTPGFTAAAVATLALGIGVNTAAFSMVNALIVRPLPFPEPERLVTLQASQPQQGIAERNLSMPDLRDVRERTRTMAAMGGMYGQTYNLADAERAERVDGEVVTHEVLPAVGVRPLLGRFFRADEDRPGAPRVTIVSHWLWTQRLGGRPDVVGSTLQLDGVPHTVVGVMPPGFKFPLTQKLWVPMRHAGTEKRNDRYIWTIARLRPGVTVADAHAEMAAIGRALEQEHPSTNTGWRMRAKPLVDEFVEGSLKQMTILMQGAVGFVLLIACANVANLMLARATGRRRELALRAALGASRWRVVRQLVAEGALIAGAGAALGVLLARGWNAHLLGLVPEELPFWVRIEIDPVVLAYTAGVTALSALLFAAAPALRATRGDLTRALRDGGRSVAGGVSGTRMRSTLVTTQVGLAVVLLVGASLMVRSFVATQRVDLGTDDAHLLTLRTFVSGDRYKDLTRRAEFFQLLARQLAALPGARAAAVTTALPADDGGIGAAIVAEGRSSAPGDETLGIAIASTPGLFEALGAGLLSGRDFTAREAADTAARVAILNRSLAERLWPGASALGRRVRLNVDGGDTTWVTVVGVAPDLTYEELGQQDGPTRLQVHIPYARLPWRGVSVVLRAEGDPGVLANPARAAVRALDPALAAYDVLTMREVRRYTTYPFRLWSESFGVFGLLALLLAAVGVYGVMAYGVTQRRQEIGVRMALGARAADVLRQVVRQGARLALPGAVLGFVGAVGMSRLMRGVVYGVDASDPATLALVPAAIVLVALVASWVPARRASRVDPATVLRSE
jgi:putative ABC transport system permease protein